MVKRISKALAAVIASAMVVTMIPFAAVNAAPVLISANPTASDTSNDTEEFTLKQTSYNSATITFADNDSAKKAVVSVDRMKESNSKETFYLKANAKTEVAGNTVVITRLSNGVKYRININGVEKTLEMNVGDPASIEIDYPTAYVSTAKDISGNSIKNASVTPVVTVYDANGVIVETDSSAFTYATDKKSNVGVLSLNTKSGLIKFSKANSICYGTVTYTYTDSLGEKQTLSEFFTAYADEYTAPTISEVPVSMVLTDKKGKNITYSDDDSFSGELKVGDKLKIAYYFLGSDGKKYVTASNKEVSYIEGETEVLDQSRVFYLAKGDQSATHISLSGNTIVGLSEGTEQIALYEKTTTGSGDTSAKDELICVLTVTVNAELYPDGIELSTDNVRMLANYNEAVSEDYRIEEIKYTVTDQFGDELSDSTVSVYYVASDGKEVEIISFDDAYELYYDRYLNSSEYIKNDIRVNGVLLYYFDTAEKAAKCHSTFSKNGIYLLYDGVDAEIPEEPMEFKVVADKNPEVYATFTVELVKPEYDESGAIKTDGYEIKCNTVNLTDKSLYYAPYSRDVGTTFKMYKTYDGLLADVVPEFYVVSDQDVDEIGAYYKAKGDTTVIGNTYLVITDEYDNVVTETKAGNKIKAASETSVAAGSFFFDTLFDFNNRTSEDKELWKDISKGISVDEAYLTGNFTVTAYQVQDDYTLDEIASSEFSSENKIKGLQNLSMNKLTIENGKVKETSTAVWKDGSYAGGGNFIQVAESISNNFMAWFDADDDGVADNGEVMMLRYDGKGTLDLNDYCCQYNITDVSAVVGADYTEYYIKTFDYQLAFKDTMLIYEGTYSPRTKFITSGLRIRNEQK